MEYIIIRSKRKTISIEIDNKAQLIVRCPMRMPQYEIKRFIDEKDEWIKKHTAIVRERMKRYEEMEHVGEEELNLLKEEARAVIPDKVRKYACILGVTYGRICIRNQKTLWGSCSRAGNLNFNCLLMKAPDRVQDYVVVHELCHRIEMNHSRRFWSHVESVIPDYRQCRKWLFDTGSLYLR